jgi:hypothetical protein
MKLAIMPSVSAVATDARSSDCSSYEKRHVRPCDLFAKIFFLAETHVSQNLTDAL